MNASKFFVTTLSVVSLAGAMGVAHAQTNSTGTTPSTSTTQQAQPSPTPAEMMDPTMPNNGKTRNMNAPATNMDGSTASTTRNTTPSNSSSTSSGSTGMQTERLARADRN